MEHILAQKYRDWENGRNTYDPCKAERVNLLELWFQFWDDLENQKSSKDLFNFREK